MCESTTRAYIPRHRYQMAVEDSTLPGTQKAALQCLSAMAEKKEGGMGPVWPCHEVLALAIGCTRATVRRALSACEAAGWVVVERIPGYSHWYTLTIPRTFERHASAGDDGGWDSGYHGQ